MQALAPFARVIHRQGAFLTNADLSTNPSFTVSLHGASALLLFVTYTRTGGAATAVTFSGTSQITNAGSTNFKITGANQSAGTLTRTAWSDTYAVSATDSWQVIVPVCAGNTTISVSAAGATSNDTITVYVAEAA